MYEEPKLITREQAEAALVVVRKWISTHAGPGEEPKLYEPGHESPEYWNISLEGAMHDWPYLMSIDTSVTWPDGVWVEAGSHFHLALHAA